MDESDRDARRDEANFLAEIGQCLFEQDVKITVRLPAPLATAALAAWARDDLGGIEGETPAERTNRLQAGHLALIGLAVEQGGTSTACDEVEVALDAWQIGSALEAADQRGLLTTVRPPRRDA